MGNEEQTPQEVFSLPTFDHSSDWAVRVVPNRFAALELNGKNARIKGHRLFHKMDGIGLHEVIVESPSHNIPMALMTYQQVEKVLKAYQQRYNILKKNRQFKFITIFKNHGWASGTSLAHPHSQLVAMPIAAPYYRRKFDVALYYYDNFGRCLYCDLIAAELEKMERIVTKTKEFVVLHPYASRAPFETWIVPKKHYGSFGFLPTTRLSELAMVLKDTLFCLYQSLDDPDFNLMIDTATTEDEEAPYYHWHIRVVPRLSTIAGFEMGSGIYINTALPEDTARLMKEVANTCAEGECLSFKRKN
jgi:UDPglucose--hexose-1-phosphate uridylyltransferase